MKRTLKRELKVLEIAKREAMWTSRMRDVIYFRPGKGSLRADLTAACFGFLSGWEVRHLVASQNQFHVRANGDRKVAPSGGNTARRVTACFTYRAWD